MKICYYIYDSLKDIRIEEFLAGSGIQSSNYFWIGLIIYSLLIYVNINQDKKNKVKLKGGLSLQLAVKAMGRTLSLDYMYEEAWTNFDTEDVDLEINNPDAYSTCFDLSVIIICSAELLMKTVCCWKISLSLLQTCVSKHY